MDARVAIPFHFATEFAFLVVAATACAATFGRARGGGGWRAATASTGFGLLCVAQILHGARVAGAAPDGALIIVVLRAAGYACIAVLTPSVRSLEPVTMLSVAVPLGAAQLFSAGQPAGWAVVPGVAAALIAVRALIARARSGETAIGAFAIAFALIAAGHLSLGLFARGDESGALVASHVLRLAGALFLARWLQSFVARRVRLRFIAVFIVALVALVVALSASLNVVVGRNLQNQELVRAQLSGSAEADALTRLKDNDASIAQSLASLVTRGLPPGPSAASLFGCFYRDLSFIIFVDPATRVSSSALGPFPKCNLTREPPPRPAVPGRLSIPLAGTDEVQIALRTSAVGTLESVAGAFASVAAAPYQVGGRTAGALVLGHLIDDKTLALAKGNRLPCPQGSDCVDESGDDLTILVGGRLIATTFNTKVSRAVVARDLAGGALGQLVRKTVEEDPNGVLRKAVEVAGRRTSSAYIPLRRSFGQREVLAVLVASRGPGALIAAQESIDRILFLIALFAAVIAAIVAARSVGRLMRPIASLTKAAEAVRAGDMEARVEVSSPDEIGELGRTFNDMASSLDRTAGELRAAARAEAGLRLRLEAIMQSMGDALVATDADGRIVAYNAAAEQMIGTDATRALGRPLPEVLTGDDGRGGSIAHAALTGRSAAQASISQNGKGSIPVALTSAPLLDAGGEPAGRVVVLRDISAEMQAERMKSEFLSNVSHELRTPLTPIKGYTEILKRKKVTKEKAESFLDGILESTSRLERIVEILVEFAAMEAGRLKPRLERIGVKAFLDEHLTEWKRRAPGHRFTLKIPARLPAMDVDPRLLGKCFDELVDNAVKFSPNRGRIEIEAHALAGTGRTGVPRRVRIDVRDHGIGIAKDQMKSLFMDFRQIDGSETREYGGLGLGLAYAKRVATVHGGDVSAQSSLGKGSTFSLMVPAADTRRDRAKSGTET